MLSRVIVSAYLCFFLSPTVANAGGTNLTTELVVSGLDDPLYVTHVPGDFERIFIVEQPGTIRVVRNGALLGSPFLDITGIVDNGGNEQGLLGLAFPDDYLTTGAFYVNYTRSNDDTVVARYSVDGDPATDDTADAGSAQTIMIISQPQTNHNGGWMGFSPIDGYLYIATGDGGGGGDTGTGHTTGTGNAQDITSNLLGKMLRIDVTGDDFPGDPNANYAIPADNPFVGVSGDDEIWAYGLRNPWRPCFDRENGDLWIADVGQGSWEEVNHQPASSSGGENYGWRCYEGNADFNLLNCDPPGTMVFPVHEYSHAVGFSITGGCVYRGCAIEDLKGTYFFADYGTARIWSFRGPSLIDFEERTAELDPPGTSINSITSFGEDALGEVYICDRGGEVFRIVSDDPLVADCNENTVEDACDILSGDSLDENSNDIPDECEDEPLVPTASQWGMVITALLLVTAGTVVFRRRSVPAA